MGALRAVEPDVIKQATKPAQAVGTQSYIIERCQAPHFAVNNSLLRDF